jgi:hypothetical protein
MVFGAVALTGLKENDIVVNHQCSLFKHPDNAPESCCLNFIAGGAIL